MSPPLDEIQVQLDELDTRLDRLRASYEQYFVGIEKIEPHVQRKDVERRFQVLRKMQLRNTATRFRFQALVQKYTTYITYWQRICRQIEEGTWKREAARVQRYGKPVMRARREDAIETLDADDIEPLDSYEDLSGALGDHDDRPTNPPAALAPKPTAPSPAPVTTSPAPTAAPIAAPPVAASPAPKPAPYTPPAQFTPIRPIASIPPNREHAVEEIPLDELGSIRPPPPTAQPAKPVVAMPKPAPVPTVPTAQAPRRGGISPWGGPVPNAHRGGPPPRRRSSSSMKAVKPPSAPNPTAPATETPAAVSNPGEPPKK